MSAVESAARRLLGSRFRLHGRDPETGLDCVGLVAAATGALAPSGYALRSANAEIVAAGLEAVGLVRATDERPGDVVLMRVGPAQLHLGIRTRAGLIHADAGLRRVVERPGTIEWEVVGSWRR